MQSVFRIGLGVLGALALSPASQAQDLPRGERVRGITISTHGIGRDWGDADRMRKTLRAIQARGAEWFAIHPYARIHGDGRVTWRSRGRAAPAHWTRPIEIAHELGLKILIKPHLAHWGSPFDWRGAIQFKDAVAWKRFFADYRAWILELASACAAADGFSVGCELDRTTHFEAEWRALIRGVRARSKAALTYASNWDSFEGVRFWDALDCIGIQAYFPLSDRGDPDRDVLVAAWRRRMASLRRYAHAHRRNIVFTELGYNRSFQAAKQPWAYATDGAEAEVLQARCMGVALDAIEAEGCVLGCFLWKWFPGRNPVGRDFQLATPAILREIERRWRR